MVSKSEHGSARHGHLAMLLFSALVAGSFSLGALIARDISPIALSALRFGAGALMVGAVLAARGGLRPLLLKAPWRFLLLGGIFSGYFVLMFEGLKTAAPVPMAAVFTLTPVMAAGFGWLLLRQITTRWTALALLVAAVGALWVIFRADFNALLGFNLGRGEAIFFIGCVLHALYVPLLRRLNRGESALASTFGVLLAGALILSLAGWGDIRATNWVALPGLFWLVLGYLMVFATATTFTLVQFASMRLPASKVMAYTYLTPSWVILWELALGRAAPPLLVLGGIGLTLLALLMLLRDDG